MHNISWRSPRVWLIVFGVLSFLFAILLYYQHLRFSELELELQNLKKQSNQRLVNLEFIANAHTEHLRNIDLQIYDLQEAEASHDWRIRENSWDLQRR